MNLFIIITSIIILIVCIILYSKYKHKSGIVLHNSSNESESPEKINIFKKGNLRIISYKEALEASKQFIYEITRAVIQKFNPADKKALSDIGKSMVKSGMEYYHVVDVFSLSIEKQKSILKKKENNQSKGL